MGGHNSSISPFSKQKIFENFSEISYAMASYRNGVKMCTNLTGMGVAKNPLLDLNRYYSRTLRICGKMPQDYSYWKNTEQITNERLNMLKSTSDLQELEKKINCGQIEEVVIQAEREMNLSKMLLENRAWEPLIEEAPANQWKWPM